MGYIGVSKEDLKTPHFLDDLSIEGEDECCEKIDASLWGIDYEPTQSRASSLDEDTWVSSERQWNTLVSIATKKNVYGASSGKSSWVESDSDEQREAALEAVVNDEVICFAANYPLLYPTINKVRERGNFRVVSSKQYRAEYAIAEKHMMAEVGDEQTCIPLVGSAVLYAQRNKGVFKTLDKIDGKTRVRMSDYQRELSVAKDLYEHSRKQEDKSEKITKAKEKLREARYIKNMDLQNRRHKTVHEIHDVSGVIKLWEEMIDQDSDAKIKMALTMKLMTLGNIDPDAGGAPHGRTAWSEESGAWNNKVYGLAWDSNVAVCVLKTVKEHSWYSKDPRALSDIDYAWIKFCTKPLVDPSGTVSRKLVQHVCTLISVNLLNAGRNAIEMESLEHDEELVELTRTVIKKFSESTG
jgi:hypothetical protein